MFPQAPWMMAPNRMPVAQQYTPNTQPNPMMSGLLAQAPQAQGPSMGATMGQMLPLLGLLGGQTPSTDPAMGVANLPQLPAGSPTDAMGAQMQFQNMMGGQAAPEAGGMGMLQNWFSNWRGY